MFQDYQSKPVVRRAHEIGPNDGLLYDPGACTGYVNVDGQNIKFKAFQCPVLGDYVVYLNDSDIYHCERNVFFERNIVPEVL